MTLEEHNGVYLILQGPDENFWQRFAVDVRDIKKNRPKLKTALKEWWDTTAHGEWTTTYVNNTTKRAIVIRNPSLFMLFKLAFTGTDALSGAIRFIEGPSIVYAPYIPQIALHSPCPVFQTRYGLAGIQPDSQDVPLGHRPASQQADDSCS